MENHKTKKNTNRSLKGVFLGMAMVIVVLIAFFCGYKIGKKDSDFRYPPFFHPFVKPPKHGFVPKKFRSHGLIGVVDSVSKESFVIKSRWGELIPVLVDKNTKYKIDGKTGSFSDIKKGKNVMVIGEPNEQELAIKAKIVRIF